MLRSNINSNNRNKSTVLDKLIEMVVPHKVIDISGQKDALLEIRNWGLFPVLDDDGKLVKGEEQILLSLEDFKILKEEWDKYQSDLCYCDDEGKIE